MDLIAVGRIVGCHGVRGEVKVYPLSDFPERFTELSQVIIKGESFKIEQVRWHKGLALVTISGVADRSQAEQLVGEYVKIPETELFPLPEDTFYTYQLLGCKVRTNEKVLGTVRDVLKTGGNDVLVVTVAERERDILLPATKEVVRKVDISKKVIDVKLLPGLLDL